MKNIILIILIVIFLSACSFGAITVQQYSNDSIHLYSFITTVLYSNDSVYIAKHLTYGIFSSVVIDIPIVPHDYFLAIQNVTMTKDSTMRVMITISKEINSIDPMMISVIYINKLRNDYNIIKKIDYIEGRYLSEVLGQLFSIKDSNNSD